MIRCVRALAFLLGLFMLGTSFLDLFGLIPYSGPAPTLAHRLVVALPLGLIGACLVIPYRFVRSTRARAIGTMLLCMAVAWCLYLAADAVRGYLGGVKTWHVVPVAGAFLAVTVSNVWAFRKITDADGS